MRWLPALAAYAGLAAALSPPAAVAAPTVLVRARTQIQLQPFQRKLGDLVVRGLLTDQFSDAPVPWVPVTIRLGDYRATATTDGDGAFQAAFAARDGTYDLAIDFAGTSEYAGTSFRLGDVDVSKGALSLRVTTDREVDFTAESVRATVTADAEFGAAPQVQVEVYAGPRQGELAHIGSITTDDSGRGSAIIDRERLGGPGRKRVQVRYIGDRSFNPTEASTDFALVTSTATTFSLDAAEAAFESAVVGRGRVVDANGAGVARGPVAMVVGTRRIGETLTDAAGNFVLRVSGSEVGAGKFNVQAVFDPATDWYKDSRSDVVSLTVAQPQPIPMAYTVAAFAATALAMLAFVGLRTRPWQGVVARLRRRSEKPASKSGGTDSAPEASPGLKPARASLVSTLRRPHDVGFTGAVVDAVTSRPVAGAQVTVTAAEAGERSAAVDRAGKFAFEDLDHGSFQVVVQARGYVTERFAIAIPHRGELRGARIDLLSVRERIFQIYRDAALPLLPEPRLWGIWTPRQIFDHVRSRRPARALRALTDFVEESYFSQRAPDEHIIGQAVELSVHARAEAVPGGPTVRNPAS